MSTTAVEASPIEDILLGEAPDPFDGVCETHQEKCDRVAVWKITFEPKGFEFLGLAVDEPCSCGTQTHLFCDHHKRTWIEWREFFACPACLGTITPVKYERIRP